MPYVSSIFIYFSGLQDIWEARVTRFNGLILVGELQSHYCATLEWGCCCGSLRGSCPNGQRPTRLHSSSKVIRQVDEDSYLKIGMASDGEKLFHVVGR